MMNRHGKTFAFSALAALLTTLGADAARACGCFAPPDVSVPILQAGERIVFAQKDGVVTAHIQVQYEGKPADFGWLLPLPAVPRLKNGEPGIEISTDELFSVLVNATQPRYRPQFSTDCAARPVVPASGGAGCGGSAVYKDSAVDAGMMSPRPMDESPLVVESSIGPYDYAVLKADKKDEMLRWLQDSRFVVPTGIDGALTPYIRPGAFLLALKLRAGQASGDLQPVVVRYAADLPMIPLTLTQVGATPNMGVQVFLLGPGRGIPRNYYHVVLNEANLGWYRGATNYDRVVSAAVAEAPGKHAFVTEYAGSNKPALGVLDRAGRFAKVDGLKDIIDPVAYVEQLREPARDLVVRGVWRLQPISGVLPSILSRHIPRPKALADRGVELWDYYLRLREFLVEDRRINPQLYTDIEDALLRFDPVALTAEIRARVVVPTLDAGALLGEHPYLTRLFTRISPQDMTKDPVFSYNRELPAQSNERTGIMVQHCDRTTTLQSSLGEAYLLPATALTTGYNGTAPYARRIEVLADTGAPQVVTDNPPPPFTVPPQMTPPADTSTPKPSPFSCTASSATRTDLFGPLGLLLLCAALLMRRRRR